jgi:DNA-binding transcriptional MerR regulator
MTEPITDLSAAACAMQTGLTVRALRVYESQGLLKPERSPAGWRRYGTRELLRLNQIALLKVLGLTLSQIKALLTRPSAPSLEQLLQMQLSSWRERRCQAERGEAVTEAALRHLQSGGPLPVEALCNLIRSIDMKTLAPDAEMPVAKESPPANSVLDRFVGHYLRNRALGAISITRNNDTLVLEPVGKPGMNLEQTGEADFMLPELDLVLSFEQIEKGAAQQLVVWLPGVSIRLQRTDESTAKAANHAIEERIRDGRPMTGSANALRRLLDGFRTGAADYDAMSPQFAEIAQGQIVAWQITGQYFGAILALEFVCVSPSGWDIYQVQHENDVHRYRLAMGDDGKVHGFTEASATAEKRAVV